MVDNYDGFGDVQALTRGIFGSEQAALAPGLDQHTNVVATVAQHAVLLRFDCQVCGQTTVCEVHYPEIVALKYGVNPAVAFRAHPALESTTRWEYLPHAGGWNPKTKCSECRAGLDIVVEPHEPERFLQAARRKGFINAAGERQVSQICAAAAQAGHAVVRRG